MEATQDALIELLLLNHTDFVLGSSFSSFSTFGVMRNLEHRGALEQCLKKIGPTLGTARFRRRRVLRRVNRMLKKLAGWLLLRR